jgi:hypothetical protein
MGKTRRTIVRRSFALAAVLFFVALTPARSVWATNIALGFSSVPTTPNLVVAAGGTFTIGDEVADNFDDIQIDASDGVGDSLGILGDLDGTFTIGAITSVVVNGMLFEIAGVSGVGSLALRDAGGAVLRADLEWVDISTISNSVTVNTQGLANLSNITYGGASDDLRRLAAPGIATIQLNGFAVGANQNLSALVAGGGTTDEYSGNISAVCCTAVIGDFVWLDVDCDGRQDPGELGINGLVVTLKDSMGNIVDDYTTTGNGHYEFRSLCAGSYTVEVDLGPLSGSLAETLRMVGDSTGDSNGSPASVTLPSNSTSDLTIDFGYKALGSIGDRVWKDLDCDGRQDAGEPGINGVRVELRSADGTMLLATTTTSGDGNYSFTGLESGICGPTGGYLVVVDQTSGALTGCTPGCDLDGGQDARARVSLGAGQNRRDVDFAFCPVDQGGEGCTPGYWKQAHHFDSWPAPYTPSTLFSSVFENAFPGKTLLDVLSQGGGGICALGRHTVAALLNSASSGVDYDLTTSEVISHFNAVFPGTTTQYNSLKNIFEDFNEQDCPLN